MLLPTIFMGILALVLFGLAAYRGKGQHTEGLRIALKLTLEILPLLLFSFVAASLAQVLIPKEVISKWIGSESGLRGILLGTVVGGFTPGGPYVSLPIVAGLMRTGAGAGTVVAFVTSWSLWAVTRLPMEIGILGWKMAFIRLASTFFFPPVAGLIAHVFFPHAR